MVLVLDGEVNSTCCNPVDFGCVGLWKENGLASDFISLSLVSKELLVLEVGPGGHEVVSDGEAGLPSIDLVDLNVLLGVESKSELVLLFGTEGKSELRDVISEGLLELKGNWLIAELLEAKIGSGFTDILHLIS